MKILLNSTCVYPVPPPGYAGTEWVVYDLAIWLQRLGHEVTVAAPRGSSLPNGIDHIPTGEPSFQETDELWMAWLVVERLRKEVDGFDRLAFDIVHDHSFIGWPYLLAEHNPEFKVCRTLHWDAEMSPPPVPHPNFISISDFMARNWSRKLGIVVEHVYNGIEPERFLYSKTKGDRYLFLSRIRPAKGALEVVRIAKQARVPVDIVGEDQHDPSYAQSVKNAARGTSARYVGPVSHEDKLRFLADARALLMPVIWEEPFGLVVIEANASGTPVIGLRKGALPEIVIDGKTGFLCSSVDEMAECIGKESEIEPQACREHVERYFTAERMARDYERLYRRILDGDEW